MEKRYYQLNEGTVLNDRYVIERVLGNGGFGITYLGHDEKLDMRVAVKEYFPNGLSTRNTQVTPQIIPNQADETLYEQGKSRFLKEARILAKLSDEEGIVGVHDFFEENNTCYIVMEYIQGISLSEYLRQNGPVSVEKMLELLTPVMHSLTNVHKAGLVHRDISPGNIMITEKGQVKLLDFGAARDISKETDETATVITKKGFAPFEQYSRKGELGPWTDVYGLAATMYYCITGHIPNAAIERVISDDLESPSALGFKIKAYQEKALLRGLALFKNDRFQSVEELYHAFITETSDEVEVPDATVIQTDAGAKKLERSVNVRSTVQQQDEVIFHKEEEIEPKRVMPDKEQKGRKATRKKKRKLLPVILGIFAGILAVGITVYIAYSMTSTINIGGKSFKRKDSVISISLGKVTQSQLKQLHKFTELSYLALQNCYLTNEDLVIIADELGMIRNDYELKVDFTGNQEITDITPLAKLENLATLCIDGTAVTDLSCLTGSEKLNNLSVDNMEQPLQTESLSALTQLQRLSVIGMELNNIAFVQNMSELTVLDASDNQITDISALAGCETINELTLSNNPIEDLEPLRGKLENLRIFECNEANLRDISVLEDSYEMHTFFVDNNKIENLDALSEKNNLYNLSACNNIITDISVLASCHKLSSISLSHNQITDISALENLKNIKYLYLNDNQIEDISPLAEFAGEESTLESLTIDHNQIRDISVLANFDPVVYSSDLSYNQITDISPLAGKTATMPLGSYFKSVNDAAAFILIGNPFTDLKQLLDVGCGENAIIGLTYYDGMAWNVLDQISNLKEVYIVDCPKDQEYYVKEQLGSRIKAFFVSSEELNKLAEQENQETEETPDEE